MNFAPGDKVGVRGFGPTIHTIVSGPHTIDTRPANPHDQHMWTFRDKIGSVAQHLLVPWAQGLQIGDDVPNQRSLKNIVRNKTRNQTMRNIWERRTNTSSNPGTGPLNSIKRFVGKTRKQKEKRKRSS